MAGNAIIRLTQLGGSIAEPLAVQLSAELMARGFMRTQIHAWNDHCTLALVDGEPAGLIAWRTIGWAREAFIALGGVVANHRRKGVYRALFNDLVADLTANHPAVEAIASGHHVANHESRAMHEALGRQLDGLSYRFPLPGAA